MFKAVMIVIRGTDSGSVHHRVYNTQSNLTSSWIMPGCSKGVKIFQYIDLYDLIRNKNAKIPKGVSSHVSQQCDTWKGYQLPEPSNVAIQADLDLLMKPLGLRGKLK
jgi:hypothetical protein